MGSICILMESCEFCQYQLEILPIRRLVADPIGISDQCFQIEDVKGSFNPPGWLFGWLLSVSRNAA